MNEAWSCSDANDDGFVSLQRLRKQAAGIDRETFVSRFPAPALVVVDPEPSETGIRQLLPAADRGVQLLTERIETIGMIRYLGKAAFVTKRPGNPFPHLISIGRSKTNDITVMVDSVSKVHGYFVWVEGRGWCITDHESTNGTRVDRQVAPPSRKVLLENGCQLRIGLEASFQYFEPAGFYDHLRAKSKYS